MNYLLVGDLNKDFFTCVGRYPDYRLEDPMSQKREINEVYLYKYSLNDFSNFIFYTCIGILPSLQEVSLEMTLKEQFLGMMAGNLIAFRMKYASMARNDMRFVDERDLTEIEIINERLKFIRAKKKEADDKTREAFTK